MAKNKLVKFAEMETLSNVYQPRHCEIFQKDYFLKGRWNQEVFGNDRPIVLEIGCGKGEYTVGLGELYPDRNFIGIDIKGARMWHGAKSALEKKMTNVLFLRTHAELLGSLFAPEEITEIWITFPDPQMSKARKRLTGSRFLNLYRTFLKKQGIVHLKTDSPFLYRYTLELIELNHLPLFVHTDHLYSTTCEDKILGIKTFYEQQWIARGKQIKYIQFTLEGDFPLQEPTVEIEKDDYHSEARYMGPVSNLQIRKDNE